MHHPNLTLTGHSLAKGSLFVIGGATSCIVQTSLPKGFSLRILAFQPCSA